MRQRLSGLAVDVPKGYNPCTDVPESALKSERLVKGVADNKANADGPNGTKWRGCRWVIAGGNGYSVAIQASNLTIPYVREHYSFDVRELTVAGRPAITTRRNETRASEVCNVNVEIWYSDANDRFPRPLKYLSRFAVQNDFDQHRLGVRARYSRDELEEIEFAMQTLSTSDMRIEILGGSRKHKNSTGEVKQYRILGARNVSHAVVAFQTVLDDENGPIRLRTCPPESLAAQIVRSIPPCQPGKQQPATFHPDDLRPNRDTYLQDNARNTPREQY